MDLQFFFRSFYHSASLHNKPNFNYYGIYSVSRILVRSQNRKFEALLDPPAFSVVLKYVRDDYQDVPDFGLGDVRPDEQTSEPQISGSTSHDGEAALTTAERCRPQ